MVPIPFAADETEDATYQTWMHADPGRRYYLESYVRRKLGVSHSTFRQFLKGGKWEGRYDKTDSWVDRASLLLDLDKHHVPAAKRGSLPPLQAIPTLETLDTIVQFAELFTEGAWQLSAESLRRKFILLTEQGWLTHYRIGMIHKYEKSDWLADLRMWLPKIPEALQRQGRPLVTPLILFAPYWRVLHETEGLDLEPLLAYSTLLSEKERKSGRSEKLLRVQEILSGDEKFTSLLSQLRQGLFAQTLNSRAPEGSEGDSTPSDQGSFLQGALF